MLEIFVCVLAIKTETKKMTLEDGKFVEDTKHIINIISLRSQVQSLSYYTWWPQLILRFINIEWFEWYGSLISSCKIMNLRALTFMQSSTVSCSYWYLFMDSCWEFAKYRGIFMAQHIISMLHLHEMAIVLTSLGMVTELFSNYIISHSCTGILTMMNTYLERRLRKEATWENQGNRVDI